MYESMFSLQRFIRGKTIVFAYFRLVSNNVIVNKPITIDLIQHAEMQ